MGDRNWLSAALDVTLILTSDHSDMSLLEIATWVRWLEQAQDAGQDLASIRYVQSYHEPMMLGEPSTMRLRDRRPATAAPAVARRPVVVATEIEEVEEIAGEATPLAVPGR